MAYQPLYIILMPNPTYILKHIQFSFDGCYDIFNRCRLFNAKILPYTYTLNIYDYVWLGFYDI